MTHDEIVVVLVAYLTETNPLARKRGHLPLDQSLHELGILDSSGIVELVSFIEDHWSIAILDSELTKEMFGGLGKIADLIGHKLATGPPCSMARPAGGDLGFSSGYPDPSAGLEGTKDGHPPSPGENGGMRRSARSSWRSRGGRIAWRRSFLEG